jgi:hypothetical protein
MEATPPWHRRYRKAFTNGFVKGQVDEISWTPADRIERAHMTDLHVLFGPNYWPKTMQQGDLNPTHVLCVDRCSVGDKNDFVTIGWDGWGGEGEYPKPTDRQLEARYAKWGHLLPDVHGSKPKQGDHCVIVGEYPSACDNVAAINRFYNETILACKQAGRDVFYRPHPQWMKDIGCPRSRDDKTLHTANTIFTYRSSFGVDCALRGLPVMALRKSLASRHHTSLNDFYEWRKWLLFTQWHISEIESGEFWEYLKDA